MCHLLLVSHSLLFRLEPFSRAHSARLCNPLSKGAQLLPSRKKKKEKKGWNVWIQQNVRGPHFLFVVTLLQEASTFRHLERR